MHNAQGAFTHGAREREREERKGKREGWLCNVKVVDVGIHSYFPACPDLRDNESDLNNLVRYVFGNVLAGLMSIGVVPSISFSFLATRMISIRLSLRNSGQRNWLLRGYASEINRYYL